VEAFFAAEHHYYAVAALVAGGEGGGGETGEESAAGEFDQHQNVLTAIDIFVEIRFVQFVEPEQRLRPFHTPTVFLLQSVDDELLSSQIPAQNFQLQKAMIVLSNVDFVRPF
jgi:hypothetical protein